MIKSKLSKYLLLLLLLVGLSFHFVRIDKSQVNNAAEIIGLDFNDSEIDSLIGNLENAKAAYISNQKLAVENSTSPAMIFDPRPSGFKVPIEQDEIVFEKLQVDLPENINDLAFYSVSQLSSLIKIKKSHH